MKPNGGKPHNKGADHHDQYIDNTDADIRKK
jgi:hypothetical protein